MVPKTAQTIAAVLMLAFMLVGGYYVRNIPSWISWLKYLGFQTVRGGPGVLQPGLWGLAGWLEHLGFQTARGGGGAREGSGFGVWLAGWLEYLGV